jgi:hypothetical protein
MGCDLIRLRSPVPEKPLRLRFDSQDDALNFVRKSVEESRHWLAARNLTFAQRYVDGQLDLLLTLKCTACPHPRKFNLLLQAIPAKKSDRAWTRDTATEPIAAKHHVRKIDVYLQNNWVLARPRHPAHLIKNVILSTIRLESPEEGNESGGGGTVLQRNPITLSIWPAFFAKGK